jgi:acyl-homoserine-lactone acylase
MNMNRTSLSQFVLIPLFAFIILLSGCHLFESDSSTEPALSDPTLPADWVDPGSEVEQPTPVYPEGGFDVEVKRTTYGIPHVTADNWGSLGYGLAYAYAQDNFCLLTKEIVKANGESARYLEDGDKDLNMDFLNKLINADAVVKAKFWDKISYDVKELISGYTAGYNRYLADTGADYVAVECRGQEWIRPATELDFGKVWRTKMIVGGFGVAADYIVAAEPPGASSASSFKSGSSDRSNRSPVYTSEEQEQIKNTFSDFAKKIFPDETELGSNAYALGSDVTASGKGILLGNPHFPWQGSRRFYQAHLSIPGTYDVMGALLSGSPIINIGFNKDLAWSHTVSTGSRFTLFEIVLDPNDPTRYQNYEGTFDMATVTVSAKEVDASGNVQDRQHTFYVANNALVMDLTVLGLPGGLGVWNGESMIFAMRDAVVDNIRGLEQWMQMGQATTMDDFKTALEAVGMPWVNTIAADRVGNAFYGDISNVPNVTVAQMESCISAVGSLLTSNRFPTLDISKQGCDWADDDTSGKSYMGYENLPKLTRSDYVANMNDSYWLSNPDDLLTGYSPIIGKEGVAQSLRTRLGFIQIEERLAATDGLDASATFTLPILQNLLYGSRVLSAEMALNDIKTQCAGYDSGDISADVVNACAALSLWDGTNNLTYGDTTTDNASSHVFKQVWSSLSESGLKWDTAFDATDPVHTPSGFASTGDEVLQGALAASAQYWADENISMDASIRDMQRFERGDVSIPIHGGSISGSFSIFSLNRTSGDIHGNSYIQTVTWDETECPDAYGILTYSQSTDPYSDHFADQTALYSTKGWIDFPFCSDDISSNQIGTTLELTAQP